MTKPALPWDAVAGSLQFPRHPPQEQSLQGRTMELKEHKTVQAVTRATLGIPLAGGPEAIRVSQNQKNHAF